MAILPPHGRRLVMQAILRPVTDLDVIARLFWPTLLPFALSYLRSNVRSSMGSVAETAYVIILLLVFFMLLARGLVGWHRWCVLGERPAIADISITGRDAEYWLGWLALGVWFGGLFVLITVPIIFASNKFMIPDAWAKYQFVQMILGLAGSGVAVIVFSRTSAATALELVAIAVAPTIRRPTAEERHGAAARPGYWQALAIVVLVGPLVEEVADQFEMAPVLCPILAWVALTYGFVAFATVLSVHFRQYFLPLVDNQS